MSKRTVPALLLAAPASGSGKTTLVSALLKAFQEEGLKPHAFKCGPDYIDPMFHQRTLGVPCRNLDLYLTPPDRLATLFQRYAAGADLVVAEGVMGFYDGVGGVTSEASAWHVADTLKLPVVLVVTPKGSSLTLAAQIKGLVQYAKEAFQKDSHIKALLLNRCSAMLYRSLKPMLEAETGLPVLGYLPDLPEASFDSRHLGLQTAAEIPDFSKKLELLGNTVQETVDLKALLALGTVSVEDTDYRPEDMQVAALKELSRPRIAVAKDAAFSFCYEETLDAFREAGAEPVLFSPLQDKALPEHTAALYLPGGYPELYAKTLSENESLLAELRQKISGGLPTVAECGGFLYLQKTLETPEGEQYPLVGLLPGDGQKTARPQRFGYAELTAEEDNLLTKAGTPLRIHNFHYWESTARGNAFSAVKPVSGRAYETGFATDTLYAGFPHIYFAGNPEVVSRFVEAARTYQRKEDPSWEQ